ncbi:MAG: SUMF1/EgtB/PvdO family nonheme iron enzyme, partial [Deltaproteobacteria bacterium]|nr:SUMF1/EgtB/PvdO family nonheme iron enzyme [Deltaproteobacteria bacterium]
MKNGVRFLKMLGLASFLLVQPLRAQTVTNIRAQQQADKTVEVLYDLSGVAAGGATVSIAFSSDGGETYTITPATSTLSGHVGAGLASGTNRRIVWNAAASLPANAHGTSYKAAVTATNPSIAGQEISFTLPGGVSLAMVKIPAGTFQMGSPASERGTDSDEHPVHQVTLTSDYYIGKFEVTQAQWRAVMGANPSDFESCGGDCPVEQVSWDDIRGANGFIGKLRALLGDSKFRLPTEAEWERAARGGTQTRFSFGDALDGDDACGTNTAADPYVWWCGNADGTTHPVGTKGPNPYGLFDMHGNVWEWVEDWYGTYPTMEQTDPPGVATGSVRTIRGGTWFGGLMYARSADRGDYGPGGSDNAIGFRLAAAGSDTACSNVFTIDLREAACSLTCSVGVATAAVAGADISFWASATPSNCMGPISYQWSFGDSEPGAGNTSSLQNAVHRYASPGTYLWALNALTPGATCTKTGSIVVSAPPAQPPILFAHSICSGCDAWKEMAENLRSISTARYGSAPPLDLYFDGTWVRDKDDDSRYFPDRGAGYGQMEARRMYTITYFDPAAGSKSAGFDRMKVKDIPIEGLAGQLAAVVAAIRSVNHTVSVDVVSHGLGGLVTRTLIEDLGSETSQLEAYVPGSVRQVVTIDTPHSGYPDVIFGLEQSDLQKLFGSAGSPAELAACFAASSEQKEQMRGSPMSEFLKTLNGRDLPASVPLTAVATTGPRSMFLPGLASDGIVATVSQDIKTIERYRCAPSVTTIPSTASGPIAHLTVLGVMDTGRLVDSILARPHRTEETGGCQAFSPFAPTTLAVPNLAQSQPGARTLVLTFPAGGTTPNEVPESASSVCWATVVARADDGRELARQEVPAVGTQMVQFGILPASGWHIELLSTCAVTVFARVDFTPADSFGAAASEAVLPIVLD